jgi:two-component system response regulator MtrA
MVTILVIGKEMGDQLARCMAPERVRVLGIEDVGEVRLYDRARAVVLDASVVPLDPETFQGLREEAKVPLLAVVPTYEEARLALQLGCDEVLVRPFDLEELKLRAHKVLGLVGDDRLLVGELLIDLRAREVWRGEEELHLSPLQYDLLTYLAGNPEKVVKYDELLDEVWRCEACEGSREMVKMSIRRLRGKIEGDPGKPRHVVSVRGRGYMLKPG